MRQLINILRKFYILPISIFFAMLIPSCSDFLDVEPVNDLIKDEFWSKREDVESAIAATYDSFRDGAEKSLILGELRADMIKLGGNDFKDYVSISQSNISYSNDVVKWGSYYNTINLANTVLLYAPEAQKKDKTLTDEIKNGIDAEAIFLRSLSYFYLVRLWKEVPLMLSPSASDTMDMFLPKSPEHVVLNQITNDLKIASSKAFTDQLSDNIVYYKGRANKYAIQALLADVLLWSEKYQECITYCDSIIKTGKFGLEPFSTWFNLYYPGNSLIESIFEIQYDDAFEKQENPIYDKLLKAMAPTPQLNLLFQETDIRFCEKKPVGKYLWVDINANMRSPSERDANIMYYRYSDILLMKAEALIELGNFADANYLLADVSARAGITYTQLFDKKELREYILSERGREFALEGKRWFDILRFAKKEKFKNKQIIIDMVLAGAGIKEQAILKTKVYDTMSYYLPIHINEILYNQKLVQNPFYDR